MRCECTYFRHQTTLEIEKYAGLILLRCLTYIRYKVKLGSKIIIMDPLNRFYLFFTQDDIIIKKTAHLMS